MATNENILKAISKLYKEKHSTDFIGVVEEGKVIIYEEGKHLKKLETKNVESFGDELSLNGTATAEDFNLD